MKAKKFSIAMLLLASAAAGTAAIAFEASDASHGSVSAATARKSQVKLLFAQPFVLDQGYQSDWRADHPAVSAGYIVALAADTEVMPVMQVHHPLLFAGDMPVERVNEGSQSGVYIGFVPSALNPDGSLALDLATTPIYWAKPEILPESLTPDAARAELERAVAAGVAAQKKSAVDHALAQGGGAIYLESHGALYRYAADVIERFSPVEADLVAGLRAPIAK